MNIPPSFTFNFFFLWISHFLRNLNENFSTWFERLSSHQSYINENIYHDKCVISSRRWRTLSAYSNPSRGSRNIFRTISDGRFRKENFFFCFFGSLDRRRLRIEFHNNHFSHFLLTQVFPTVGQQNNRAIWFWNYIIKKNQNKSNTSTNKGFLDGPYNCGSGDI